MNVSRNAKLVLLRLRDDLRGLGAAALLLIAAVAMFQVLVVRPMQARQAELEQRLAHEQPRGAAAAGGGAEKVAAVYDFLRKDAETTDWLARLHGIGAATGVQLKSASYRAQHTEGSIVRYEMVLPVSGNYRQIREFLSRSLAEIPVMSIDQLSLKRESRKDEVLQAQLRVTLHMVN